MLPFQWYSNTLHVAHTSCRARTPGTVLAVFMPEVFVVEQNVAFVWVRVGRIHDTILVGQYALSTRSNSSWKPESTPSTCASLYFTSPQWAWSQCGHGA